MKKKESERESKERKWRKEESEEKEMNKWLRGGEDENEMCFMHFSSLTNIFLLLCPYICTSYAEGI